MNAVSIRKVRKAYAEHVAVDEVSFEVPRGAVYGLLGRNGAGKTTTIRMLMDILRPDSGELSIFGQAPRGALLDKVGYLPEERGLYKRMYVIDVLVYLGGLKGVPAADARQRATQWLERVELGGWEKRKVEELSKGMAQKVQFISTLLARPELLILDEPFSGLDPVNTNQLRDIFLEISRAGTTILFSTHQMESAERLCDAICIINKGRVVEEGPVARVREKYGRNNVALEFDGDGTFLAGLPFVAAVDDNSRHVEVSLKPGADPQELLKACVGRIRLHKFEVVNPTLQNIFIALVGQEEPPADVPPQLATPVAVGVGR